MTIRDVTLFTLEKDGTLLAFEGSSKKIPTVARIEFSGGDGKARKVLASCESGCLIGEIALFVETTRPATATASRMTDVMEINRALFTRMLNEYPHVALRLRAALSERLTATVLELGRVKQALDRIDRPAVER